MFPCHFCGETCATPAIYVKHMRIHNHVSNSVFCCCIRNCNRKFKKHAGLKSHVYRHHKRYKSETTMCTTHSLECHVDLCSAKSSSLPDFISHIKMHIKEGRRVTCPFMQCGKTFAIISTFTSPLSRKHKEDTRQSITIPEASCSQIQEDNFQSDAQTDESENCEEPDVSPENVDETLFLRNLALFYLKLQAKLLLPASVIQTVIEDIQSIHEINLSHMLFKLQEKLVSLDVPEAMIKMVLDDLKAEDLFTLCNSHTLRSDQRRKSFFKNSFHYVEPVPIRLGQNEAGKECFAQYIPVKQTIESLLNCKSVREQYRDVHSHVPLKDILKDVWGGENVTANMHKIDKSSLGLILYQDSFEVVNPLGSGRKKHKILAMYLTLADLCPYNRSSTDQMQLVFLCREQDFKYFGEKLVMRCLVDDLKDLETTGVCFPDGLNIKAILWAIAGDNLGSHSIGGFVENFSGSTYFCR